MTTATMPRNGESNETEVVYDAEAMANARLIAAAPDLLAACKAAVSSFTIEVPDGNETIRQLNEAIRKATEGIR